MAKMRRRLDLDKSHMDWLWMSALYCILLLGLFWPALTENASMQWDASEIYLPWKYYVTEQFRLGHLPLWNPYMSGGFPQHGDPGTWYEVSYLFAFTHAYDLQSLLYEYLFHLVLAFWGFGFLLRTLGNGTIISGLLGMVYSLNGFFLGNAQHLGWIIGFAWLPWFIACLMMGFRHQGSRKELLGISISLGITAHFLFVGGYLGVTAMALYGAMFLWVLWVFSNKHRRTKVAMGQQIRFVFVALLVFVGLSLPALLSFWDLQSTITRTELLSLKDLQFGHWPWRALTSMFWVEPDATMASGLRSDISLINVRWSGFLMLLLMAFLFLGLAKRLGPAWTKSVALVSMAVLCFWVAVGPESWFHGLLIPQLPLLRLFRFPALYRGAGLFLLTAAAAMAMSYIWNKPSFLRGSILMLILCETVFFAYRDIQNTVLVKIPAYEVNEQLRKFEANTLKSGGWRSEMLTATAVDSDSIMSALVPFMNQNQGIYLKQWATDGYNPYQIRKNEAQRNVLPSSSQALIAVNGKGEIMLDGIQRVGGIQENGQFIAFRDVVCSKDVKSLIVRQTPSKHWHLTSGEKRIHWKAIGQYGIQIPAVSHFQLEYTPGYLNRGIFFVFGATWILVIMALIINTIPFWVRFPAKKH